MSIQIKSLLMITPKEIHFKAILWLNLLFVKDKRKFTY